MTIGRHDFLRVLPTAVPLAELERAAGEVVFGRGAGRLVVRYQDSPPVRLGALDLPTLAVRLTFTGFDDGECAAILAHFDRMSQRGGG